MRVIVNGQEERIDGDTTVASLLRRLGVQPVRVAVEVNEDVISRKTFDRKKIHDGDRIEIVTFIGGG